MDGSRTIRVLKRDGSTETFDVRKLAAAMWRAMQRHGGRYKDAYDLAVAIDIYLKRRAFKCVSSAAIFEMSMKVLCRVDMSDAAGSFEVHRRRRDEQRRMLCVRPDRGAVTYWDKSWLRELVCWCWNLSPTTGRIIAGELESELLDGGPRLLERAEIVQLLNERVVAFGLADAVPVNSSPAAT